MVLYWPGSVPYMTERRDYYTEYHSLCPFFWIGSLTPFPQARVCPPPTWIYFFGGDTLPCGGGGGGSQFRRLARGWDFGTLYTLWYISLRRREKESESEKNLRDKTFKGCEAGLSWAGPGDAPHLPRDSAQNRLKYLLDIQSLVHLLNC
jgi:hypothetical protein